MHHPKSSLSPAQAPPLLLVGVLAIAVAALVTFVGSVTGCQQPLPPQQEEVILEQAKANIEKGNLKTAMNQLSKVLVDNPQNTDVMVNLSWIYVYLGEYEKATAEVKELEQVEPDHPDLYYLKGRLYAGLERWMDALEMYNTALEADVNNPQLHADIAEAFLNLREAEAAEAAVGEFQVAMRLSPDVGAYTFGLCRAYRQTKQYDEAIDACQSAKLAVNEEPDQIESINEVIETIKLLQSLDKTATNTDELPTPPVPAGPEPVAQQTPAPEAAP